MNISLEQPKEEKKEGKIDIDSLDRKLIKGLTILFAFTISILVFDKIKTDETRKKECEKAANGEAVATGNLPSSPFKNLKGIQEYCSRLGIEISDEEALMTALANLKSGREVSGQFLWQLGAIKSPAEISQSEISSPPAEALEN